MPFIKKKEAQRREKVSKAVTERHVRNRNQGNAKKEIVRVPVGRRVFELALLATSMWCDECDIPLSFRFLEEEQLVGLSSVFKVRCTKCLMLHTIKSSSVVPDDSDAGRVLAAVNCKAALGCLDSGVGHEQLNKLLSAMNLPIIHRNCMKRAEERMGKSLVQVAQQSCKDAIHEEKSLTQSLLRSEEVSCASSVNVTPTKSNRDATARATPEDPDSGEVVPLKVRYDFGWDKRGSGFKYDSHSGRGSLIGTQTNKVLGYEVVSSYCAMCARGGKQREHDCAKNYEGSSKGMEPKAAVKLCLKNPNLDEAGVIVKQLIADRDCSTMAALRQESPHVIEKIIDINHNTKSVNNALWKLKKSKYKSLPTMTIDYLKRNVAYAIKQNAGNVEAVRAAIMNISNHAFGEHDSCGEWCEAKDDPNYIFRHLPEGKPFSCDQWRQDLNTILQAQADEAEMLAPAGSSLQNERFNHMCNTRAPKSRFYCGTQANFLRVSAAVSCKNLGAGHLEQVFRRANLSPSTSDFRLKLQKRREWKVLYQNNPEKKKRRLFLKMRHNWSEAGADKAAGLTYVSGMSTVMERAAVAASVPIDSWLPETQPLSNDCQLVIVDIETSGLAASAEIVQLAAKCGGEEFTVNILPKVKICPRAAAVTGLRVEGGKLWCRDQWLPTVPASEAAKQFLAFLKKCSSQVVLVGHNIVRFDAPRILKFLKDHGLAKEFCDVVHGLCDSIPLIKQGKIAKQDLLAQTYLKGPEWERIIAQSHDALSDCVILDGLLKHFKVSDSTIFSAVLPMRDFLERNAQAKKKKDNTPALNVMLEHGVSKGMIGKMASAGVSVDELVKEYRLHGRKGLEVCLGVQVNGKPRVTTMKKIISQVEAFVRSKVG